MVFGETCSSAQLEMVLTYHIKQFASIYPRTVALLLNNLFEDDVVGGGERREDVERFVKECNIIAASSKDVYSTVDYQRSTSSSENRRDDRKLALGTKK